MAEILSDSPDIDSARDRLGVLLEHIRRRNNFGATPNGKRFREEEEERESDGERSDDQEERGSPNRRSSVGISDQKGGDSSTISESQKTKSGPGSESSYSSQQDTKKRRVQPQKRIIFELRQKAFEIQNSNLEHGLYALCRIWMRGKSNKDSVVSGEPIDPSDLDYVQESTQAASAITRKNPIRPEHQRKDGIKVTGHEQSPSDILKQYLPRWRQTKKDWCQQRNRDDVEKYGDSLRVLRDMYASAQSHVIL